MIKRSKWNDRNRHKDGAIKVQVRQSNRRERHNARSDARIEVSEALADLRLDRVISMLCREAGV